MMFNSWKEVKRARERYRKKFIRHNECCGSMSPWIGCSEQARNKTIADINREVLHCLANSEHTHDFTKLSNKNYKLIMANLRYARKLFNE